MGDETGQQNCCMDNKCSGLVYRILGYDKIGAVLVSVNNAYKIHKIENLLRQSDTHKLIMVKGNHDTDYSDIMNELCPEIKTTKKGKSLHYKRLLLLRNIITVDFSMDGCYEFNEAISLSRLVDRDEIERLAKQVFHDDVCNMQYISSTTGFPKCEYILICTHMSNA